MANVKMGFEGLIYEGVAGSTATTLLENTKDITYNLDVEKGDTTVRGDSTSVPLKTEQASSLVVSIDFTMIHDITDTAFAALLTAAYSGGPIAIRTKDYTSGSGFDGDCVLTVGNAMPISGEQAVTFNAVPTRESGRAPSAYV